MNTSARARRFLDAHDVVAASTRLVLSCAVAALVLVGVAVLAPAATPADLVSMAAALAGVFAVVAGAGVVVRLAATSERGVAGAELVEEIDMSLGALPPAAHR